MPQATQPISPPQAKNTIVRAALTPTGSTARPTSGSGTVSTEVAVTTQGTAEDVSATLSAALTGSQIQVGTTLELSANETIPANSTFVFPPVARIRQSADIAETVGTTTFSSFDHAQSSVSIGEGSATGTFNGGYSYYDAFFQTLTYAKDNTQRLFVERETESPDSTVFSTGPIIWGICIATGITSNAQDGSNVSGDITVAFDSINRIDPQT